MANRTQQEQTRSSGRLAPLALQREATRTTGSIRVSSPQLTRDAAIPARHTAYGDGQSPVLQWAPVGGARSYALLVEDPDAPTPEPFVHWLAWNIPPGTRELPANILGKDTVDDPPGMRQGRNDNGGIGWFGPRPPQGDPPHHYHFQVLALDAMLDLPAQATRDDLLAAIDGGVLAKGELVATSEAPTRQ